MEPLSPGLVEWGAAELALPGQAENGDRHIVRPFAGGVLAAVMDGLGHGREAAEAARIAVATLEQFPFETLPTLFRRCHERLRGTRGVVMSAASFRAGERTMLWLGVGNVEGLMKRATPGTPSSDRLLLRGGVVGSYLPRLDVSLLPAHPGDVLIFASDGVRSSFADEEVQALPPQQAADRILARHGRGTDDALVLVVRYRGGGL